MKMAEKLDTGDILAQRATAIAAGDTAATLHERLARLGAQLLAETLENAVNNNHRRPSPNRGAGDLRAQNHQGRRPSRLVAAGPFLVESRPRLGPVAGGVHLSGRAGRNCGPSKSGAPRWRKTRRRARHGGASGQGGNCGGLRRRRIAHSRIATGRRPPFDRRRIPRRPPLAPRRPAGVTRRFATGASAIAHGCLSGLSRRLRAFQRVVWPARQAPRAFPGVRDSCGLSPARHLLPAKSAGKKCLHSRCLMVKILKTDVLPAGGAQFVTAAPLSQCQAA